MSQCQDTEFAHLPEAARDAAQRGLAAMQQGCWAEARDAFQAALRAAAGDERVQLRLAQALEQAGEVRQAAVIFDELQANSTDFHEAAFGLAVCYGKLGRTEDAQRLYLELAEAHPGDYRVYTNLASVAMAQGDDVAALRYLRTALAANPDYLNGYYNLGNLLCCLDRLAEAVEVYRTAVEQAPESALMWNCLGLALEQHGERGAALEAFRRALDAQQNFAAAYSNLGVLLRRDGNMREAEDAFQAAVRFDPSFADAFINLGNLCYYEERDQEALSAYEQALAINPDHEQARRCREVILEGLAAA